MLAEDKKRNQNFMTATPDKYPQGYFKIKGCKWCSIEFQPLAPSHLYCSQKCRHLGFEDNYYQKEYGVSLGTVNSFIEKQNNLCYICEAVRGLLCHNCNRALGLFKDKISLLEKAIEYLKKEKDH